jgi:hypothetical protein
MKVSLTEFRKRFLELALDFLWRQWSAMGVAGHDRGDESRIVDPEALLLFTCILGRHDPRLFDEVIDWLQTNGSFINILRLRRMMHTERFAGGRVLAAIAGIMSKGAEVLKWKKLAESDHLKDPQEALFFGKDGKPLPVIGDPEPHFIRHGFRRGPLRLRNLSQIIRPTAQTNLLLQLRALFGINARSEIVAYLLTHDAAHPSQIARDAYYYVRAVQNTLVEMNRSSVVQLRTSGREKHYWMRSEPWAVLLNRDVPFRQWITWAPLFSALERIWLKLNDPNLAELDPLLQSSEVRQLMIEIRPSIARSGFDKFLVDDRTYPGEKYLPAFTSDIAGLFM